MHLRSDIEDPFKLYNNRMAVCYRNLKNRDGTTNLGWKVMTEMVEQLGPAGMSSDESEVDTKTKKTTYIISVNVFGEAVRAKIASLSSTPIVMSRMHWGGPCWKSSKRAGERIKHDN